MEQRTMQSLIVGLLSPILKGKGRMRAMLLFQSSFVFALFTIHRSTNDQGMESLQNDLFVPVAAVKEFKPPPPQRLRSRQEDIANDVDSNSFLQQNETTLSQHSPTFFSNDIAFESLLVRDNLLTVYTGCSIAAWTYGWHQNTPRLAEYYDDCGHYNAERQWEKDVTVDNVSQVQTGDTIYVELKKLDHFVQNVLPLIEVDVVLISGQNHIAPMKPPLKPPYSRKAFRHVMDSPNVKYWFMMNLDKHSYEPFHPKVCC